jgi:hypothetical protein
MKTLLVVTLLALSSCGGGSTSSAPVGPTVVPPPTLLIIGDSHVRIWGEQAGAANAFPGWKVRYAGVGGQISAQIHERYSREVPTDVTVVVAGTNDIAHGISDTSHMAAMAVERQHVILFRIPPYLAGYEGERDVNAWNAAIDALPNRKIDGYAVAQELGFPDAIHFDAKHYKVINARLQTLLPN